MRAQTLQYTHMHTTLRSADAHTRNTPAGSSRLHQKRMRASACKRTLLLDVRTHANNTQVTSLHSPAPRCECRTSGPTVIYTRAPSKKGVQGRGHKKERGGQQYTLMQVGCRVGVECRTEILSNSNAEPSVCGTPPEEGGGHVQWSLDVLLDEPLLVVRHIQQVLLHLAQLRKHLRVAP